MSELIVHLDVLDLDRRCARRGMQEAVVVGHLNDVLPAPLLYGDQSAPTIALRRIGVCKNVGQKLRSCGQKKRNGNTKNCLLDPGQNRVSQMIW